MSKIIGKTKGTYDLLEVPLCEVREGMRGERIAVTVSQKSLENVGKTSFSAKNHYAANPMGPGGGPCALGGPQSPAKALVENPW